MIASIEGHLGAIEDKAVVIQVGGIGFRVYVPGTILARCGPVGSAITLFTHLHVREDEMALYGCASEGELDLFELLLGVSGVGPRVALAMLSTLSGEDIRLAIASERADVLARVPGIGTKTAKKIVFELKDKIAVDAMLAQPVIIEEDSEVIAALTSLGYSVVEAQTALQHVSATERGVEERLRAALAYLGS